ncbi:lysozyme inhibitor LprI family protein [Clostridium vincentii]|uniref:Lysozyme inhibitor LprI-like N-terminal domain-containing protein n=1 Tax=Clostridium vincentii TaxID=52704 RepID=A0A2T0BDC8_9CLOT|nr:lysozyme inhibitor LprI family protein [Clostridium vincentii]PRR81843.1 hypothetical protein CLVI_21890 [Clostridium vincentii]
MKRTLCVFLIMLVSLTLISCGDSEDKKAVDKSTTTEEEAVTSDTEDAKDTTVDNEKVENSEKQIYIDKLDNINAGLTDLDMLYKGSATDMKTAVNEEYTRWDNALNEIYGVVRTKLSTIEMSNLEKEEFQWIKDKEATAKEASSKFKGGTAEILMYTESLANTTKDRGYELVQKYMTELA